MHGLSEALAQWRKLAQMRHVNEVFEQLCKGFYNVSILMQLHTGVRIGKLLAPCQEEENLAKGEPLSRWGGGFKEPR